MVVSLTVRGLRLATGYGPLHLMDRDEFMFFF